MLAAVANNNKLGHVAADTAKSSMHSATRLGISSSGRRTVPRPTSQFYQSPHAEIENVTQTATNIRRNEHAVEHASNRNTDAEQAPSVRLRDARTKPFNSTSVNKESSVKAKVAYNRKYNVVYLDANVSIQDFLHTIGNEICAFPQGQLFTVKWLDEDNDLCTISHQIELDEAMRLYHENHDSHLVIHVFPSVPDRPGMNCAGEDRAIKRRGAKQWEKQYLVNGHVFKPKRFHPSASCALCTDRVWGLGRQGLRCQLCKVLVHKKCHRFIPFWCKFAHPSPHIPARAVQQRIEEAAKLHTPLTPVITTHRISTVTTTNRTTEPQQPVPITTAMTRSASISSSQQPHSRSNSMNWPATTTKIEPPSSSVPSTAPPVKPSPTLTSTKVSYTNTMPLTERHYNDQQPPPPPTRTPVILPDMFPIVSSKAEPVVLPPSTPVTETGMFGSSSTGKPVTTAAAAVQQQQENVDATAADAPQARMLTMKDFQLIKVIGRGSYAKVFAARFIRNSRIYAMKVIKKEAVTEDEDIDWIQTEKHVFEQASNYPFLVGLHSCFQTPSRLCFVIEFVSGGDLMFHMQRQRRLPESHARFYASEIILALNYLHRRGIIYRDLKLDNVLLDADGHIKLTDYGMCKEQIFAGSKTSTFCGTPNYIAPEILRGEHYDHSVDFWALGVLMYEMMAGRSPFDIAGAGDNPDQNQEDYLFQVILEKPIRIPRNLSVRAGQVLKNFLNKDPLQRLGCNQATGLADIQAHAFFRNNVDWERLEAKLEQPPFRPTTSSLEALENFDPTFTSEPVQLTPDDEDVINKIDQSEFDGFEYVNPFIMAEDAV